MNIFHYYFFKMLYLDILHPFFLTLTCANMLLVIRTICQFLYFYGHSISGIVYGPDGCAVSVNDIPIFLFIQMFCCLQLNLKTQLIISLPCAVDSSRNIAWVHFTLIMIWRLNVEIKCQLDATDDFYCRSYCCCPQTEHTTLSSTPYQQLENQSTKYHRQQPPA